MATEKVGRAVLELSTESGTFFADLGKVKTELRGVGSAATDVAKDIGKMAAGVFTGEAALGLLKTAAHALVDEFKTLTLHGAAVGDVAENYERLTAQAGHLGSTLLGVLRAGTHNTIDDFTLMKTVNQDLAAGLRLTDGQFATLAKGAFSLAQATGGDVAEGLETMNDAMVTGRARAIALLTGKVNLEAAEEKFARSLGKTRDNLTEEGKIEADRIGLLDAVGAATKRLGDQTDGLDERVAQAKTFWANFENELGRTIATSPVIEAGLLGIKDALEQTLGTNQEHLIGAIAVKVDELAIAFVDLAKSGVDAGGFIIKEWFALNKVFGDTAQIIDGVRLALMLLQRTDRGLSFDPKGWKEMDDRIGDLLVKMNDRGKSLQQMDRDQSGVDATTTKLNATLEVLKNKMAAARASADAHTAASLKVKTATDLAAEAAQRQADFLKASSAELAEQRRQIEIYGQQFATWADAIVGVRMQVAGLTEAQKTMIATGLDLGLSVKEITDGLKKQYPALVIGTAALDAYTTGLKNAAEMRAAISEDVFGAGGETKVFSGLQGVIAAESAATAELQKDQLQSQQENADVLGSIATRRAQFEIDAAKRAGASWQDIYALERQLAETSLQATLASIARETAARAQEVTAIQAVIAASNAAGIDTTPEQERSLARAKALLESQQQLAQLKTQEAVQDFEIGEAEKQDAIRRTYNVWVRAWDQMRSTAEGTIGSVASGIAKMENETVGKLGTILFGFGHDQSGDLKRAADDARLQYLHIANSGKATAQELGLAFKRWHEAEDRANYTFGERFKDVWRSVKSTLQDILNDILKYFTEQFLVGLIKGISGAKLGQRLGGALAAGIPMAGGGGGGLANGIVQGGLNSVNPLGGNQNSLMRLLHLGGGGGSGFGLGQVAPGVIASSAANAGALVAPPAFLAGAPALGATGGGVVAGSTVPATAGASLAGLLAGPAAGGLVGGLVGYKTGSKTFGVLSGAATGAAVGAMFGGPIGAGIGAGVGALAGLIGGIVGGKHKANAARDKFLAQFAAFDTKRDPNNPPGFYGLAALTTKYKHKEYFDALVQARNQKDVKKAEQTIAAWSASTLHRNLEVFHRGGVVGGDQSTGTDEVLIKALKGEGILTPEATEWIGGGPMVKALNAGAKAHGHIGGLFSRLFHVGKSAPKATAGSETYDATAQGDGWQNGSLGAIAAQMGQAMSARIGGMVQAANRSIPQLQMPMLAPAGPRLGLMPTMPSSGRQGRQVVINYTDRTQHHWETIDGESAARHYKQHIRPAIKDDLAFNRNELITIIKKWVE